MDNGVKEQTYSTQNSLLLDKLMTFYTNKTNMEKMLSIINGTTKISLRIVDWFATNYAKKHWVVYNIEEKNKRFIVYNDYKLHLKAYSKRRFDPFCRWERIDIPYHNNTYIQTTLGQLNFFKWALENKVIDYIEENYKDIEADMNIRNSTVKRKPQMGADNKKTRKKREELSVCASKSIKKEKVEIVVSFK